MPWFPAIRATFWRLRRHARGLGAARAPPFPLRLRPALELHAEGTATLVPHGGFLTRDAIIPTMVANVNNGHCAVAVGGGQAGRTTEYYPWYMVRSTQNVVRNT